jgi:hypothetical protein
MAREVYQTAVAAILGIIALGALVDLLLVVTGSETVSGWLTDGRLAWWFWPAGLMLAFIVVVTIHLLTYRGTR